MTGEYEYHINQVNDSYWIIYKTDHHCKEPVSTYNITKVRGIYHCDCPAPKYCKHMDMVKPKKDLF
jgi:hypothetical protein